MPNTQKHTDLTPIPKTFDRNEDGSFKYPTKTDFRNAVIEYGKEHGVEEIMDEYLTEKEAYFSEFMKNQSKKK